MILMFLHMIYRLKSKCFTWIVMEIGPFLFLYNNAKICVGLSLGLNAWHKQYERIRCILKATKYDVCHTVLTGDNKKKCISCVYR